MISAERIMGFVEGEECFSISIGKCIDRRPRKEGQQKLIHNTDFDLDSWLLPKRGNHMKCRAVSEMAQNNKKQPDLGV